MKKVFFIFSFFALILLACDDIFVDDISNEEVIINCPRDGLTVTPSDSVLFWWESLDGAEGYDLQIVSPDFENITDLLVNTSTDTTCYIVNLPEGSYQWRIRAYNDAYYTPYITRSLYVIK